MHLALVGCLERLRCAAHALHQQAAPTVPPPNFACLQAWWLVDPSLPGPSLPSKQAPVLILAFARMMIPLPCIKRSSSAH